MKIIIPVWAIDPETINVTEAAIESLKGHEIIIVDNGSTVGGGQLREWADLYIRNKTNLGFARAVNQGLRLSGFPAVVANNDIRVSPNWAEVTEKILKDDPKAGTIHYRMTLYDEPFRDGTHTWETGRERWCTGSFLTIAKEAYYDENYLNSYDDWDLLTSIRKRGLHTIYTTKASYQHLDSFTQKKIVDGERAARNERNREFFKSKHGEYPEDMYIRLYPEQMSKDWRSEFNEL